MVAEGGESLVKEYEAEMKTAKNYAMGAAFGNKLSNYLVILGLAWGTILARDLETTDLIAIGVMSVLHAVRVSAASFFGHISPFSPLFKRHTHRGIWSSSIHICRKVLSVVTTISYLLLALRGFVTVSHGNYKANIKVCLSLCYSLIALAFPIHSITGFIHLARTGLFHKSPLKLAFYDVVYRSVMNYDLHSALNVAPIEVAFEMLRSDLVSEIELQFHNKPLLDYIYHVPIGIEMAYQHLTDSDVYKQLVAVHLAIFWANSKQPQFGKQIPYLVQLAKKMERPKKLGEAACIAIDRLASASAEIPTTNRVRNNSNRPKSTKRHAFLEAEIERSPSKNIVDVLADLVIKPLWVLSSKQVVFQVMALESCCRNTKLVEWIRERDYYKQLCEKLLQYVEGGREGGTTVGAAGMDGAVADNDVNAADNDGTAGAAADNDGTTGAAVDSDGTAGAAADNDGTTGAVADNDGTAGAAADNDDGVFRIKIYAASALLELWGSEKFRALSATSLHPTLSDRERFQRGLENIVNVPTATTGVIYVTKREKELLDFLHQLVREIRSDHDQLSQSSSNLEIRSDRHQLTQSQSNPEILSDPHQLPSNLEILVDTDPLLQQPTTTDKFRGLIICLLVVFHIAYIAFVLVSLVVSLVV